MAWKDFINQIINESLKAANPIKGVDLQYGGGIAERTPPPNPAFDTSFPVGPTFPVAPTFEKIGDRQIASRATGTGQGGLYDFGDAKAPGPPIPDSAMPVAAPAAVASIASPVAPSTESSNFTAMPSQWPQFPKTISNADIAWSGSTPTIPANNGNQLIDAQGRPVASVVGQPGIGAYELGTNNMEAPGGMPVLTNINKSPLTDTENLARIGRREADLARARADKTASDRADLFKEALMRAMQSPSRSVRQSAIAALPHLQDVEARRNAGIGGYTPRELSDLTMAEAGKERTSKENIANIKQPEPKMDIASLFQHAGSVVKDADGNTSWQRNPSFPDLYNIVKTKNPEWGLPEMTPEQRSKYTGEATGDATNKVDVTFDQFIKANPKLPKEKQKAAYDYYIKQKALKA